MCLCCFRWPISSSLIEMDLIQRWDQIYLIINRKGKGMNRLVNKTGAELDAEAKQGKK